MIHLPSCRLTAAAVLASSILATGCSDTDAPGSEPASAAAPDAAPEPAEWFVASGGAQRGPYTKSELRAAFADGTVAPDDQVFREGLGGWVRASSALADTGGAGPDDAGTAFIELCRRAGEVPRADMEMFEMYGAPDAAPRDVVARRLRGHAALIRDARSGLHELGTLGHDYSQGDELLLPHLVQTRQLAKLLKADALVAIEEGRDDDAAADGAAIGRLARQLARDRTLISSLVAIANTRIMLDALSDLDAGAAGNDDLRAVARWLDGPDPFGIAGALEVERDHGLVYLVKEFEAGRMVQYARIAQLGNEGEAALVRANADLANEVIRCRVAFDELIALVAGTNRVDPRALEAYFERVNDGSAGDLALAKISVVERVLESSDRTLDEAASFVDRSGG